MAGLMDLARQLGNALGRTEEYQALRRAIRAADDDRDLVEARNRLLDIEQRIAQRVRDGQEPGTELATEYDGAVTVLQGLAGYQRLVAAQANFDKVMAKVNEAIMGGMDEVGESRIVLPT
jgi:cell fate (sporulation/competence/biofilm development) regulator YlbF (YheA/YmcA/DUF963 family)